MLQYRGIPAKLAHAQLSAEQRAQRDGRVGWGGVFVLSAHPPMQSAAPVDLAGLEVPAAQLVQAAAPAALQVPAGQSVQVVVAAGPPAELVPALHWLHVAPP